MDVPLSRKRMKPLRDKATEGRINPKGIPCLYLATCQKIAVSEVRPWVGMLVTIGFFEIVREQKLITFIDQSDLPPVYPFYRSSSENEEIAWSSVSSAFTEPVHRSDDTADYVPTQVIAEFFKSKDFDGLAYRSIFGERGMNIALFDIDAAESTDEKLFKITDTDITAKEYISP